MEKISNTFLKNLYVSLGTTTSDICLVKVMDLHLLSHLMWLRWFNFWVNNDFSASVNWNLAVFCFSFPYAPCTENNNHEKKLKKAYLSILFFWFEHVTQTQIFLSLTSLLYAFDQKTHFFKCWSLFKFNVGLVLGMPLKLYRIVTK